MPSADGRVTNEKASDLDSELLLGEDAEPIEDEDIDAEDADEPEQPEPEAPELVERFSSGDGDFDATRIYLNEIGESKLLTAEEEIELARL
ncbi:MAG: RNA polymerase sigma factor RpoS, partial [Thiocapsa sp.]